MQQTTAEPHFLTGWWMWSRRLRWQNVNLKWRRHHQLEKCHHNSSFLSFFDSRFVSLLNSVVMSLDSAHCGHTGPAPRGPASLMSQLSRNQSYQSCKTPHLGLASKSSDFFYYQQLFIWFIEMWATTCGSLGWDRTYLKAKHDPENSEAWN